MKSIDFIMCLAFFLLPPEAGMCCNMKEKFSIKFQLTPTFAVDFLPPQQPVQSALHDLIDFTFYLTSRGTLKKLVVGTAENCRFGNRKTSFF